MTPAPGARGAGAGGGRGAAPAGAAPTGAPGAPAAAAGGPPAEAPIDPQAIFAVLGANGRGAILQQIFGGGGRGPAPIVGTGDYLVSITINGQTQKQLLHVERSSGTGGGGGGFDELLRKIKK